MSDEDLVECLICKYDYIYFYENYAIINGKKPDPLTDVQKEKLYNCNITYLTREQIIDKYGETLTESQIELLKEKQT